MKVSKESKNNTIVVSFNEEKFIPDLFGLYDKNLHRIEALLNVNLHGRGKNISISGKDATLLLNRHLPLDLRSINFSECSSASSAIHHVSIKLLKYSDNNYHLFIPRGFGLSIWEILLETAKQFGYKILER